MRASKVHRRRLGAAQSRPNLGPRGCASGPSEDGAPVRLVVIDGRQLVRAGICQLLEAEADFAVVAQAGFGGEATRLCRELEPDVVVIDFSLPDLEGLEATRQIARASPRSRMVVLVGDVHHEYLVRLVRAGAAGFVTKSGSSAELLDGVRRAARGGMYVAPAVAETIAHALGQTGGPRPEASLSDRELQILTRLARGQGAAEVAQALALSRSTVESHRGRLMKKLGLRHNADIARFAIRRGLIEIDGPRWPLFATVPGEEASAVTASGAVPAARRRRQPAGRARPRRTGAAT
ncbi:MAG: response regulator transcription factor [Deltaproteobacteria bacterium]|nr:response regulator transcription factor [Deltaproteobacteria bacterium]